ncbi:MAG: hypothetical protein H7Z11_02910 [Verrucomicrobia bacterium]|nr:hypothetical protein [Leptolyngbya sp. ES-bin-22]
MPSLSRSLATHNRVVALPDKSDRRFVFTTFPYPESSSNAAVMRLPG